jgi:Transposase
MHSEEAGPMAQQISILGIDIAKLVFHIVGMDDTGHVVLRKRLTRGELLPFIAKLSPLRIGMEACGSAHYWARCFREHGHEVRLIAPQFVKAYVKSPKHDARNAEAICEALSRPTMRFAPIKDLQIPCSLSRAYDRRSPFREALQATPPRGFTIPGEAGLHNRPASPGLDVFGVTLIIWHASGQRPWHAVRQRVSRF